VAGSLALFAVLALATAPAFAQRADAQTRTIAVEPSGGDEIAEVRREGAHYRVDSDV